MALGKYILKRACISLLLLLGISMLLYALIRAMPGDYIKSVVQGNPKIDQDMATRLSRLYGLDVPVHTGYIRWLAQVLQGDWGVSLLYREPVMQVIGKRMGYSFILSSVSLVIAIFLSILWGTAAAVHRFSYRGKLLNILAAGLISLPVFLVAVILQKIMAVDLRWFPLQGMASARLSATGLEAFWDQCRHFSLPCITLVLTQMGFLVRFIRAGYIEVLESDYIRTALAQGLDRRYILYRDALSNTLIPLITLLGGMLPALFCGAMVVEAVFALDGIGLMAFNAIKAGDIPLIMGFNLLIALLCIVGAWAADMLYAWADPRLRIAKGGI